MFSDKAYGHFIEFIFGIGSYCLVNKIDKNNWHNYEVVDLVLIYILSLTAMFMCSK